VFWNIKEVGIRIYPGLSSLTIIVIRRAWRWHHLKCYMNINGCNTRCYCSSYSTSTVASIVLIQWWLQYKPNSMKMVFFTNGVGSFWVNLKVWIFELLWSVDHWTQSTILGHTSKRESILYNIIYKYANLPKFWSSGSNCFKCPNRASWINLNLA
jgi:precorrin-6B methylase 1